MGLVAARIQAHPARSHLHQPLAESLGLPTEISLHASDPPNPWAGYRACLTDIPACSHLVVIQDDALPCRNFGEAVEQIAERHPDTPVCLFLGAAPASTAARARRARKDRYVPLSATSFVPLVCVLWPVHKAREFLEWTHSARGITRADDGNAARWARASKQEFLVSVPSLVEHNDFTPSVKGGRQHKPGAESWRRAVLLAEDGSQYEW